MPLGVVLPGVLAIPSLVVFCDFLEGLDAGVLSGVREPLASGSRLVTAPMGSSSMWS